MFSGCIHVIIGVSTPGDRWPDRGSRCCAPGAPLCPGELQILEPAFGLSGCCGEGRARCPHLSLLWNVLERQHVASCFPGFCLVSSFLFPSQINVLTTVASVYTLGGLITPVYHAGAWSQDGCAGGHAFGRGDFPWSSHSLPAPSVVIELGD